MPRLSKIWNGRISGLPSMLILASGIAYAQFKDMLSTVHWRGNLKRMGRGTVVQSSVTIRFPDRITLGEHSSVSRGVELGSEFSDSECILGDGVIVGRNVRLDFSGGLKIGDGAVISEGVSIYTHSHGLDPKSVPRKTPLSIGAEVWIGAGALIVEGVGMVGSGSIIAAGSVVTKEVPPLTLVAGVPAKVVRYLSVTSDVDP